MSLREAVGRGGGAPIRLKGVYGQSITAAFVVGGLIAITGVIAAQFG